MFLMHFIYSHVLFVILNYSLLLMSYKKKSNSKKYVFGAFVFISYFLITFLIKLTLMLFFLKKKTKMRKKKIGSKIDKGLKCKKNEASRYNGVAWGTK